MHLNICDHMEGHLVSLHQDLSEEGGTQGPFEIHAGCGPVG